MNCSKKRVIVLGVLIFLTLFVSLDTTILGDENNVTNRTVVIATSSLLNEYNYIKTFQKTDLRWMNAIFTGLYYREPTYGRTYLPALADGEPIVMELIGDQTYQLGVTVKLKPGIMFSDGVEVTANDVKFTYQLYMSPAFNSREYKRLVENFGSNESIVVIDSKTIRFNFLEKTAFYYDIISLGILPKHIYKNAIDQGDYELSNEPTNYLVGAGPYKFEGYNMHYSAIQLVRNNYWSKTGLGPFETERIVFRRVPSRDEALNLCVEREVDVIDSSYYFSPSEVEGKTVIAKESIFLLEEIELILNHIHPVWGATAQLDSFINKSFSYDNGKFFTITSFWDKISKGTMNESIRVEASRLIRKAIYYAMPRQNITDGYLGNAEPASTIFPPSIVYRNNSISPTNDSIDKAYDNVIEAFQLAGWSNISKNENDSPQTTGKYFVGDLYKYFPEWNINLMVLEQGGQMRPEYFLVKEGLSRIGFSVQLESVGITTFFLRTSYFPLKDYHYNRSDDIHSPVPLYPIGGYDALISSYSWSFSGNIKGRFETWAFLPKGDNFYNYWDIDYDLISKEFSTALDNSTRILRFEQLQQYVDRWLPVIPLIYLKNLWLHNDYVGGIDFVLLEYAQNPWWKLVGGLPHDNKYTPISENTPSDNNANEGFISFDLMSIYSSVLVVPIIIRIKRNKNGIDS